MKIVLYGDSILASLNKNKIVSLEQAVSDDAVVFNCSAGGFNTTDALNRAEFISNLPADKFVLSFGLNDSAPWKQVDIDTFKDNLQKIIDIFGLTKVVFMIPPLVDEGKQSGDKMRINSLLTDYIDVTKQIANSHQCPVIDINPALEASDNEIHIEDGVHLTEARKKIMIETLGSSLAELQS